MALSATTQDREGASEKTPIYKFFNSAGPRLIWWALIPAVFVVLKHAGIALATTATSTAIIERLGTFWPVLPEHYRQIQMVASGVDANNAGLFYLTLILFATAAALRLVLLYARQRANIRGNEKDVAFFAFAALATIVISFTDHATEKPGSYLDFFVDDFGIYYFREIVLSYGAYAAVVMSIMLVSEYYQKWRDSIHDRAGSQRPLVGPVGWVSLRSPHPTNSASYKINFPPASATPHRADRASCT